ncbi:MAM and LDL-receptor class A domain-containing protein 1-like [Actinia tenebrosa]|uniref:Metalloendopeptidase n=1 Tax=Actinia tenebrosa TaxID=6105 RepID=A0A6P8IP03_ACTTE|nr:MAM and LDL-receptor class A domain-containing protein 1-like [Actinia tenebrosa]
MFFGPLPLLLDPFHCFWIPSIAYTYISLSQFDFPTVYRLNLSSPMPYAIRCTCLILFVQGKEDNFEKYSHGEIDSLGSTYDYDSIMHYGKYGFSANGQPTLLALGDPSRELGQREGLSTGDILKLNTLYDCSGPTGGWSSWSLFTPCDEACNQYRQRFCTSVDKRLACPEADQYGIETDNKVCANETCHAPIDGHWGRWSAWGSCSASCGEGNRTRTRECNDPPNLNGGRYCQGYANQTERCLIQSCGVGSDDCNFDEDEWCHWKHDVTGTSPLPWYRGTRGTPTSRTGPSTDHTTGTGGFLYSESSNPVQTGQSTRLISKEILPTLNARCMHFFYSMYGEGMGTLNVYLKNPITKELVRIWDTSGNQGNHWQHGDVTISTTHTYQIIFESICGSDYRSDIGLDDITFTNGSCNDKNTSTSAPTTLPTAVTTPSPADICDFGVTSGTTCTWYNDPQNPRTTDNFFRYMWWVHRGTTPSRGTGPYSDHSNHGYYIYLEASSPYCKGMKARLISKLYQPSMTMCMNFWYFMYGRSVGTLAVFIDNISGRTQVWWKRGNQADQWLHAVIPLSSSTAFKIIIEGTRGSDYLGDIALDDIKGYFCISSDKMSRILLLIVSFLATQTLQNPVKSKDNDLLSAATDRIIDANEAEDVDSKLFEGDIELSPEDMQQADNRMSKRNAQRTRQKLWRTKIIPYEIDSELVKESFEEQIMASIEEFHQHTCIRWVRHTVQKNWIKFIKSHKCSSAVGKEYWSEGSQKISLNDGCKNKGTILHEMMHATGFWHEQSRPDRNKYVEIMWENIEPGKEDNFDKYDHQTIDDLGVQYDYESIMHYGKLSFSTNGKSTIQAVGNPDMELGQRDGLSKLDKIKLNALYNCESLSGRWSTWSDFTPCNQCKKYRQRYCTDHNKALCPGADYYGIQTQIVQCTPQECNAPIDGHWGRWSEWSTCSATCDQGTHTRTRLCDDPAPKQGGKECTGKRVDRQPCVMKDCNLGPDDCEFDAGVWCHWIQDETDSNPIDWERTSKPTLTFGTGPPGDHTSGFGYYIFAESSSPATKGDTTRLISRRFTPSSGRCITFWYYMFGPGVGELRVYIRDLESNLKKKIWEKQGDQGAAWMKSTADIISYNIYEVVFEAVRGSTFQADIALDDIMFDDGLCHSRKPATTMFTSKPATEEVRPTEPYLTKAPSTQTPGETSTETPSSEAQTKVPSTTVPPTEVPSTTAPPTEVPSTAAPPTKVPSTTVPTTKVPLTTARPTEVPLTTVQPTEVPSTTVPSTTASPTEVPSTTVPPTKVPSTTVPPTKVPSITAPPTEVPSTTVPPTEVPSTTVPPTKVPSTTVPPTEVPTTEPTSNVVPSTNAPSSETIDDFCDFGSIEHTLCTWKNDPTNSKAPGGYVFDWWWMQLPTPSENTGPSADHTSGLGYYIYLESSNPFVAGNKARLLSRQYQTSTAVCLHFWYHMFGDTIGSLTVYIDNEHGRSKIWEIKGNQGNEWKNANVPIKSKSSFRIVIEGERGLGYTGDIGLDDIAVRSGSCS